MSGPNQENAPYSDELAMRIEELAERSVRKWCGGSKACGVGDATISGSGSRAGESVTVEFDGFLKSPFDAFRFDDAVVFLDQIHSDNRVTVVVVMEDENVR